MHLSDRTGSEGKGGRGSGLPAASAHVGHQEGIPAASSPCAGKLQVAQGTWALAPRASGQVSLPTCCDGRSGEGQYWHS